MIEVHAEFPQREVIQANAVVDNEEKTVSEVIISAKPEITGVTASVDNNIGTPYVDVTETGTGTDFSFNLAFHNLKGDKGEQGETGQTGNGIVSITKTASVGLEDDYTINFTNGTQTVYTVTNGQDGQDGTNGTDGTDGQDGYSPTATVEPIQDGAKITITDKNGTTTTNVYNGTDGTDGTDGVDGFSPTANVAQLGDITTITITDKNGTTTESIDLSDFGKVKSVNNIQPNANGNVTIQTGGTVDQTYSGTSANAQSGIAISGAGFLTSSSISNLANKDLSNLSQDGFKFIYQQQTIQRPVTLPNNSGVINYEFALEIAIYKVTITTSTTFYFPSVSDLTALDVLGNCVTFELYIDLQTVSTLTFPNNLTWQGDEAPDLSAIGKYFFAFRTIDGGTTWFGNLQGKW